MNKFIFKSPKGLLKNSSNTPDMDLINKIDLIQLELRHQRSEHQDILRMINRLLVDKHLQMQVDEYFTEEDKQDNPFGQTPEDTQTEGE